MKTNVRIFSQSVPVVDIIGEKIDSQAAFDEAMTRALQITPTGGTCPSAAFERSMGMIMGNDLTQRPYVMIRLPNEIYWR